jgi:hypothetical protein
MLIAIWKRHRLIWLATTTGQSARAPICAKDYRRDQVPVRPSTQRGFDQMNAGHCREDIDHLLDILRRHQHLAEPTRRLVAANAHPGRRPAACAPAVTPAPGPQVAFE